MHPPCLDKGRIVPPKGGIIEHHSHSAVLSESIVQVEGLGTEVARDWQKRVVYSVFGTDRRTVDHVLERVNSVGGVFDVYAIGEFIK